MIAIIPLGAFERIPLKDAWPTEDRKHAWMLAKMDRFRNVFATRIKSLALGATAATGEGEEPPEE